MPVCRLPFFQVTATVVFILSVACIDGNSVSAQTEDGPVVKKTTEPVFRLSKLVTAEPTKRKTDTPTDEEEDGPVERVATNDMANKVELPKSPTVAAPTVTPHPLDQALSFARESLTNMQSEVDDYTAIMAKRERINGTLGKTNYMSLKVRCPRTDAQGNKVPFSIYMKFVKPRDAVGRECIWVDGQNKSQILAHEGRGIGSLRTFHLDPMGMIALRGQRYPIYDAGIENLILKLIEKAERDRAAGHCIVNYDEVKTINKRECNVIELVHNEHRAPFEFHKAQVFVDKELQLPVRYVAYDWPKQVGGKPELMEEYTYFNIKLNVGLTDADFDPANQSYKFPGH
ncbi:MAG: DUF1571 domain-containing protein [Planctomycetota bacterium]